MMECQMCGGELPTEENNVDNNLPFSPSTVWGICSYKCQENAIQLQACWAMKEKLRNISRLPYETFVEAFGFGEAGGYAQDKYDKMRQNSLFFLYSLDEEKFKKFMDLRI